jgi:general secretion pathway protein C
MNLSANKAIEWSKQYANWLPVIQWGGLTVITVILAKLFWVITLHFTQPDVSKQKVTVTTSKSKAKTTSNTDVSKLIARHLFGSAERVEVAQPQVDDAPVTKLNLILRGTYAAGKKERSNSVIEDGKGKQAVYFVDDKLQVSGQVFLRQVHVDKVILETNGRIEELRLKDKVPQVAVRSTKQKKVGQGKKNNRVDDKRKNAQISQSLNKYREKLQSDPLSLVGLVNYQPKMVDGEMIGIEISPGKDKRLFTQLGLRRRDVITAVNGVSLTNPQDAMQLLTEIQDMQELQVDISRGNESISLLLNLNPTPVDRGPKQTDRKTRI